MPRCLALFALLASGAALAQPTFTRATGDPIVSDGRYSEGAAWGDVDSDGDLDVFVPDLYALTNRLYLGTGDGTFTEVTTGAVASTPSTSPGGLFADLDNDGDLDLFVAQYFDASGQLFLGSGDGTFTESTSGDLASGGGWSFGTSAADVDGDGLLDLFVTNIGETDAGEVNHLYRNLGGGAFERVASGAIATDVAPSAASNWADIDGDGDLDLFVPNGGTFTPVLAEHFVYRNDGGTLVRVPAADLGIAPSWGSIGAWADYDNDGDLDLFVPNYGGDNNMLYANDGDGTFTRITTGVVVNDGGDSVSAAWGDLDNDGDLDLYVTNDFNEDNDLYLNLNNGLFAKVASGDLVSSGGRSNGASWIDIDRDGDLDLYVPQGQRPATQNNVLYRNDGTPNHWLHVLCVGTASNRSAIGAVVRAKATINGTPTWQMRQVSASTGFNAQESPEVEFGLGDATVVDSLIVEWPSGARDTTVAVAADTYYRATEGGGFNPVAASSPPEASGVRLGPARPNPFRGTAALPFSVPEPAHGTLEIVDVLGRTVRVLAEGPRASGEHVATWDGRDASGREMPAGLYLARLRIGGETRAVPLVRVY